MTSRDIPPDVFTQATISAGGPADERTPLLHASGHKAKSPDADVTEEVIVTDEEDVEALRRGADGAHTLQAVSGRALWKASLILPFLGIFMLLVFMFDKGLRERHRKGSPDVFDSKQPDTPPLGLSNKITKHWGQYAPYLRAGKYKQPPDGCVIDQVNILHRHGARYPNKDDVPSYVQAITGLARAKEFRDSKMKFLEEYEYGLPAEALVPYGAEQSWRSGVEAYGRYGQLLGMDRYVLEEQVYVRTTTKGRVKDSAGNWTEGFAAASGHRINPRIAQVLSEETNNTLNDDCPNASLPVEQMSEWLSVFAPPIIERFERDTPGANLTADDIQGLMALCPFETVATERASPFCRLFTEKEWRYFEYYGDVEKYYKTGYGNPLGPIVGVGYVNELLARLTGRPPTWDHTTHNASLPFPLDRRLYVDFSHENLMVGVFAAMGLFDVRDNPPDPRRMDEERTWVARRMVPFSARMVVERLACGTEHGGSAGGKKEGEYARVLVNDVVQPLQFCGADQDGLCELQNFVESQKYARNNGEGDFEKCYQ